MRAIQPLMALAVAVATLLVNRTPGWAHGKGLYATETEAQQRAVEIGCNSIHENNERWMPCVDERELHQQLRKQ